MTYDDTKGIEKIACAPTHETRTWSWAFYPLRKWNCPPLKKSTDRRTRARNWRKVQETEEESEREKEGPSISASLAMANLPQSLSMNAPFGGPPSSAANPAGAQVNKERKLASAENLVLELSNPELRENALLELSKVESFSVYSSKSYCFVLVWFSLLFSYVDICLIADMLESSEW